MFDAIKESLADWIVSIMKGFDKTVVDAVGILTNPPWMENDLWNELVALSGVLKPFCSIIVALCVLIEIAQVSAKVDMIKWEHGLKLGVKMVLAKLCIEEAPVFLRACYQQVTAWISAVAKQPSSLGTLLVSDVDTLLTGATGIGEIFFLFIVALLAGLVIKICGMLIWVIAFGRMSELYVYLVVSPIPMAFFPLGNGNGDGVSRVTQRYIKTFIAICLQGLLIILCINIFNSIIGQSFLALIESAKDPGNSEIVTATELIFTLLVSSIVLTLSVSRCGGWAKSIIDAM